MQLFKMMLQTSVFLNLRALKSFYKKTHVCIAEILKNGYRQSYSVWNGVRRPSKLTPALMAF